MTSGPSETATTVPASRKGGGRGWVRDAVIAVAITLLLACIIELAIRTVAPQNLRTRFVSGGSLGAPDPVLGYINRPGSVAHVASPEFSVEYRISSQGFRDTTVHAAAKAPGVIRILLVGDSFTEGSGNHYEDSWPVLVEKRLEDAGRKVEIIKAGVFGYDTRQEVLYLERLYGRFRPDIVVIGFVFHDLFTNEPVSDGPVQPGPAAVAISSVKPKLHSLILAQRTLGANDALYARFYRASGRQAWFADPPTAGTRNQIAITEELLLRAARLCQNQGCSLRVLSFPQLFQVIDQAKGESQAGFDTGWLDRLFGDFAERSGFAWTPLLPALAKNYRETGEELYYRLDGHLNAAGNRVVASVATDMLTQALDQRGATP